MKERKSIKMNLLCKINSKLPTYNKYGVKEILEIDEIYGRKLEKFLLSNYEDFEKRQLWIELCNYLQEELGTCDIINYESIQSL